jgi:hypothetical protein
MSPPPAEAAPIDTRVERGSAIVADPGSGTKRVEVVRCHLEPRLLPWGTVQEAHQTDRGRYRLGRLLGLRTAFMDLDLLPALELVVVVDDERPPYSRAELEDLRAGCAGFAAWLRHGRRCDRGYGRQAV